MTHIEYYQGSLDKVDVSVRDPGWRSRLECFQGIPSYYTMVSMRKILMEMLEMEVVMMVVVWMV